MVDPKDTQWIYAISERDREWDGVDGIEPTKLTSFEEAALDRRNLLELVRQYRGEAGDKAEAPRDE